VAEPTNTVPYASLIVDASTARRPERRWHRSSSRILRAWAPVGRMTAVNPGDRRRRRPFGADLSPRGSLLRDLDGKLVISTQPRASRRSVRVADNLAGQAAIRVSGIAPDRVSR